MCRRAKVPLKWAMLKLRKLSRFLVRNRGRRSYVIIPIVILGLFVIAGTFAPFLAPHSPTETKLSIKYQPPVWDAEGSWSYPLGTDTLGRDILSRLLHGARVSLIFALMAVALGGTVGTLLGLVAGYFGSWIDVIVMRCVDLALSIPYILLAMVLAILLGPSLTSLVIVVSLLIWSYYARQARAETLSIKEKDFVALARVRGCSSPRIIARHIFPNLVHTLVVLATIQVGWVILIEASLSFVGVGIPPPAPSWGTMVADGRAVLDTAWWVSVFPGLAIGAVVLSVNLLGDWLRDTLDPRLRQV